MSKIKLKITCKALAWAEGLYDRLVVARVHALYSELQDIRVRDYARFEASRRDQNLSTAIRAELKNLEGDDDDFLEDDE